MLKDIDILRKRGERVHGSTATHNKIIMEAIIFGLEQNEEILVHLRDVTTRLKTLERENGEIMKNVTDLLTDVQDVVTKVGKLLTLIPNTDPAQQTAIDTAATELEAVGVTLQTEIDALSGNVTPPTS